MARVKLMAAMVIFLCAAAPADLEAAGAGHGDRGRRTLVRQVESVAELKETLQFRLCAYVPLGQTPRAAHSGGTRFLRRVAVRIVPCLLLK